MVWSEADAAHAFDYVRRRTAEASQLLLGAARAVLQHGTHDEASIMPKSCPSTQVCPISIQLQFEIVCVCMCQSLTFI